MPDFSSYSFHETKNDSIGEGGALVINDPTCYDAFRPLADACKLELPTVPEDCVHNAHMFYIKCKDLGERTAFIDHRKRNDIMTVFHYVPLYSAPAGLKSGRFYGEDVYISGEIDRLVRLPFYI